MAKRRSAYGNPAGLWPPAVVGFLVGLGLCGYGIFMPGPHSCWQVPLGAVLVFVSLGKMVAR